MLDIIDHVVDHEIRTEFNAYINNSTKILNDIVRYNYQIIKLQIEIFITSHVLIVDMTINESKALYSPNN